MIIKREMLISEWDSLLVSHPEIDQTIVKLSNNSITIEEAINSLMKSILHGRLQND